MVISNTITELFDKNLYPSLYKLKEAAERSNKDLFNSLRRSRWDKYYAKNIREKVNNIVNFIKYFVKYNIKIIKYT